MPGAMRKLGLYLGLVEDDDEARDTRDRRYVDEAAYEADDLDDATPAPAARRWAAAEEGAVRTATLRRAEPVRPPRSSVVVDPPTRMPAARTTAAAAEAYRITTLHPRTYNEARTIGEHFRSGTPVIMNLTEMDDVDAKRLVDFAAGLIFGLRGSIERVTNKVFLLSPEHVEVTAEDKARIAEGGFFNQS